jgi:hypothetical protein
MKKMGTALLCQNPPRHMTRDIDRVCRGNARDYGIVETQVFAVRFNSPDLGIFGEACILNCCGGTDRVMEGVGDVDSKAQIDSDSAWHFEPIFVDLKRLIFESSVRAGNPSFVAAPSGPEILP